MTVKTTYISLRERRYAKAALHQCPAEAYEAISRNVETLRHVCQNKAFRRAAQSPLISQKEWELLWSNLVGSLDIHPVLHALIQLIIRHNHMMFLAGIVEAIHEVLLEKQSIRACTLVTATSLNENERAEMVRRIEKQMGFPIALTVTEDPALLQGALLQCGSHRVDWSLSALLEKSRAHLKESLSHAHPSTRS